MKNIIFLLLLPLIQFAHSQCNGCNFYYEVLYDEDYYCMDYVENSNDCNPYDLQFLTDIISENGLSETSSIEDYDNGDGIFQPIELGKQIWDEGRLKYLNISIGDFTFDYLGYFEYNLEILPSSINLADSLEFLLIEVNSILQIPETIGENSQLSLVRFGNNEIVLVPETICNLPVNWIEDGSFSFLNNKICSHIPICLETVDIGQQFCDDFMPGDINQDGLVDVIDIVSVISSILSGDIYPVNLFVIADINEDFEVNILDVIQMVNIIMSY